MRAARSFAQSQEPDFYEGFRQESKSSLKSRWQRQNTNMKKDVIGVREERNV